MYYVYNSTTILAGSPLVAQGHHTGVTRARYDRPLWLLVEHSLTSRHHVLLDKLLSVLDLLTFELTHGHHLEQQCDNLEEQYSYSNHGNTRGFPILTCTKAPLVTRRH